MRRRLTQVLLFSAPLWLSAILLAWQTHRHNRQYLLDRYLCSAVKAGEADRVRELLAQGADPNTRELPPPPPSGFVDRVRQMLHPPKRDEKSMTPLHRAATEESDLVVWQLLAAGADPNACMGNRIPAFWLLLTAQSEETVRIALARGARLKPPAGTPAAVVYAVSNRDAGVMRLLLDRGGNPNEKAGGWTILSTAVAIGNVPVVCLLAERGADVNALGGDGRTPLEAAEELLKNEKSIGMRLPSFHADAVSMANCLKSHGAR